MLWYYCYELLSLIHFIYNNPQYFWHKSHRLRTSFYIFIDDAVRKRRKKHGGNNRKQFTEGWVEFKDKKIAKSVARSLNNTSIGIKLIYNYWGTENNYFLPSFLL